MKIGVPYESLSHRVNERDQKRHLGHDIKAAEIDKQGYKRTAVQI